MSRFRPINVEIANARAITDALYEVNGRAERHATTRYREISDVADRLMAEVEPLPLRLRSQATVAHVPAGPRSRSYNYSATSTRVTLRVSGDGKSVRLVGVERAEVYPGSSEHFRVVVSRDAMDWMLNDLQRRFRVAVDDAAVAARRERRDEEDVAAILA